MKGRKEGRKEGMNKRKGVWNGSKIGREEWEEGRKVGIEGKKKEEREELEEGREQWKLVIH